MRAKYVDYWKRTKNVCVFVLENGVDKNDEDEWRIKAQAHATLNTSKTMRPRKNSNACKVEWRTIQDTKTIHRVQH